jgi:coenzyme F420 hydrogenase subunit beta
VSVDGSSGDVLSMTGNVTKTKSLTIASVVEMGLCAGCGTCVSMCPCEAISIDVNANSGIYLPTIDSSKCSGCSLCYKVCPGASVNFKELSAGVVTEDSSKPDQILLGNYLNCYVGYSTDANIRFDSSSGGIVTQLLVFLLEEGLIDGALVTRMRKDRPLEPEPFIARTSEELMAASKSKYCPVAANVALKEILDRDGKYAVVGLPCHIHGLRKAQAVNKKLRERVVLSIGIFCSHSDSFFFRDYLLSHFGIDPDNVTGISYRGKGWPGTLSVHLNNGKLQEMPYLEYIKIHECGFFVPDRCLVCCDHVSELADFSCGDAWLPEYSSDHVGTSLVISRSSKSEKLLQLDFVKNVLKLNQISAIKVVRSQGNMRFKKNSYVIRSFLFRLIRRPVPYYNIDLPKARFIDLIRSLTIIVNKKLASKELFRSDPERLVVLQSKLKKLYMKAISTE